jgi:hypothetical protein
MVHDLRGSYGLPPAVVIDSRTLQSTPERGHRTGFDGVKRRKGSKMHIAGDTLGHFMVLHVTPLDKQDRTPLRRTAKAVQRATGRNVELA